MQKTNNIGLNKPDEDERYDIEQFNENMDIIDEKIKECFQSGSDFKQTIAEAVTAKGVPTSAESTREQFKNNILAIKTNATLQNKTATLSTEEQTIIADEGYDGLGQVTIEAVTGTARPSHVLSGATFGSSSGVAEVGTMPDYSGTTVDVEDITSDSDYTYAAIPNQGYYDENSKIRLLNSNLGGSRIISLGSGNSFDIKTIFPDDWGKFTVNNFIVEIGTWYAYGDYWAGSSSSADMTCGGSPSITKAYTNGVLTISGLSVYERKYADRNHLTGRAALNIKNVYLVIGDIETIS